MQEPITKCSKFGFVDAVRSLKDRAFGLFQSVRNFSPSLGSGMRVRPGYSAYTDITLPTLDSTGALTFTVDTVKHAPIQSPSETDVFVISGLTSGAVRETYVNPYYIGSTAQSNTNMLVNERLDISSRAVSYPVSDKIMRFSSLTGLNTTTANYYKGWVLYSTASGKTAIIASNTTDGNFTFQETVGSTGLNLGTSLPANTYLYRNFHGGQATEFRTSGQLGNMTPSFNTTAGDAPSLVVDNNVLYACGGRLSGNTASGGRPFVIFPYLKRTFFENVSGQSYTYEGTYVERDELFAYNFLNTFTANTVTTGGLDKDATYWLAVAPVYDGYQLGQLYKYEDKTAYASCFTGTGSSQNYISLNDTNNYDLRFNVDVKLGTLSKRITGLALYLAVDRGGNYSSRVASYQFYSYISFNYKPLDSTDAGWTFVASTSQLYRWSAVLNGSSVLALGNSYQQDRGTNTQNADDTVSYSLRTVVGNQHFVASAYVQSESSADLQSVFTNPIGTNPYFNAGKPQKSVFASDTVQRLNTVQTVGTKVSAVVNTDSGELIVIKDKGVLIGRLASIGSDTTVDWGIIDYNSGCATLGAIAKDDNGWLYFAGLEDIYRYRNGSIQSIIRKPDGNDWLAKYRTSNAITSTDKQNCTIWYQKEIKAIRFCFGTQNTIYTSGISGYQFDYYTDFTDTPYAWQEVRYDERQNSTYNAYTTFKNIMQLYNGTIVGFAKLANAGFSADTYGLYKMCIGSSNTIVYTDAGTAIIPYFDTGYFIPAQDMNKDYRFDKVVLNISFLDGINGNVTPMSGTLDAKFYIDQHNTASPTAVRTESGLDKTLTRLTIYGKNNEPSYGLTFRLQFNTNSSPMKMSTNTTYSVYSIDDIEFYGTTYPRRKRIGE